jgi:hypothetical protein
MSGIMDLLDAALGGNSVQQMAGQLGAQPSQVENAIEMALPALMAALERNASDPQGAQSLASALQDDHDGGLLDNLSGFFQGNVAGRQANGDGILRHMLGGQQDMFQQGISRASGLDMNQIARLLRFLAPLIMAALGRSARRQTPQMPGGLGGGLGGLLPSLLGGATGQMRQQQPQRFDLVKVLLDQNRDGNVVDDVVRMLGGLMRR